MIQLGQSNVYRLSARAKRHRVVDEVGYLTRLISSRDVMIEKRSQMRQQVAQCKESLAHMDQAIELLDKMLNDEAHFSEPDTEE